MAEFWNCLDFLQVAKVCQFTELYIDSVYFIEIWYSHTQCSAKTSKNSNTKECSVSFQILKSNPMLTELMLDAFKHIGEKSILSSNMIYLIDASLQFKYYDQESNYLESLFSYDEYLFRNNDSDAHVGLVNSLKSNGLHFILENFLVGLKNSNASLSDHSELTDLKYYTSWKLNSWTTDVSDYCVKSDDAGFNKYFYDALNTYTFQESVYKESTSQDYIKTLLSIDKTNQFLLYSFDSNINLSLQYYLEHLKSFTFILSDPLVLKEVLNDLTLCTFKYEDVFISNCTRTKMNSFKLVDDLLSIKIALVKPLLVSRTKHAEKINDHLSDLYVKQIENAIIYKRFQVGFALKRLHSVLNFS